jgi:hypothetical protein
MNETEQLRKRVEELENELKQYRSGKVEEKLENVFFGKPFSSLPPLLDDEMNKTEINRYGRQLIMDQIGPKGIRLS